jgi:hypothetical protein
VWALLRSIGESGTTVLAVCSEAPEGAVTVSTRTRRQQPADGEARPAGDEEKGAADALAETGRS